MAFFANRFQLLAGGHNLYEQEVIAHKARDFSIGIQCILAKHRPGAESRRAAKFFEDEIYRFFLRGHNFMSSIGDKH